MGSRIRRRQAGVLCALVLVPLIAVADVVAIDVPAQPLAGALNALAEQAGLQLVYDGALVKGLQGVALQGRMEAKEALSRMLQGTGLTYRFTGNNTVTIEKAPAGARVLGPVRVEGQVGQRGGANGSSDPMATEGTGSFTTNAATVASKMPVSLKETPQSVTVITHERIEQQNLTDLTSALNYTPGVTLSISDQAAFYSRGFQINNFKIDGGGTLDFGVFSHYFTTPDLAEYDHIELLRGSDALSGGAGAPGGVVSLERKRPLDHSQIAFDAQAGSWNNYRLEADITGPLAFDGALRGRTVVVYQNRDFFYKVAHQDKTLVYGVLEADLGANTLVRIGGSYEDQYTIPSTAGLPRYADGSDLRLPRSTCLCANWESWNYHTPELFVALEHRLSDSWRVNFDFTRLAQTSGENISSAYGAVDPATGGGVFAYQPYFTYRKTVQYAGSVRLSGAFELFGLKQELVLGSDWASSTSPRFDAYPFATPIPIDVFAFDPASLGPKPAPGPVRDGEPFDDQKQWGGYANVRLHLADPLHVSGGVRVSSYRFSQLAESIDATTGRPTAFYPTILADHGVVTPYAGLVYDVSPTVSAYASYADIYQSQSNNLAASGKPLSPVQGVTDEVGVKGAFRSGRINASLSLYYTQQNHQAITDPSVPQSPDGSCCFLDIGTVVSKGVDLEVSGELAPRWQLQSGYTYNENRFGSGFNTQGVTGIYQTQQPKHQLKIWTAYGLPGGLRQWTVGGGLRVESARYTAGSVCNVVLDASGNCPGAFVPFNFTQDLYAVVDMRIAYQPNSQWVAALNLGNVADTRYYATAGTSTNGNVYGEPRSFMLSLRGSF